VAYIYQVSFELKPEQMSELRIGAGVERVLSYLRALLPEEVGYLSSRAAYTLERSTGILVVFESEWETWEDLVAHRNSALAETKVLAEFRPHITLDDITVHALREID